MASQVGNLFKHTGQTNRITETMPFISHVEQHNKSCLGSSSVQRHYARIVDIKLLHVRVKLHAFQTQRSNLFNKCFAVSPIGQGWINCIRMRCPQPNKFRVTCTLVGNKTIDAIYLTRCSGCAEHRIPIDTDFFSFTQEDFRCRIGLPHFKVIAICMVKITNDLRCLCSNFFFVNMNMCISCTIHCAVRRRNHMRFLLTCSYPKL